MPEIEVIGIFKSQALPLSHGASQKLKKHLNKVGWRFGFLLFWQHLFQMSGYALNLLIPGRESAILPTWKISKKFDIPVYYCNDINSSYSLEKIKELQVDIIISAYYNQILKETIIDTPEYGVLNIHPGWLPAYRGVMSYFWVLKDGNDSAGVSIHWIDKGIDTGAVVAQRAFRISAKMTQQKVLIFTAVIGSRLLRRVVKALLEGKSPDRIVSGTSEQNCYSMPGEMDFKDYFREKRFFRIRDVLGFFSKTMRR